MCMHDDDTPILYAVPTERTRSSRRKSWPGDLDIGDVGCARSLNTRSERTFHSVVLRFLHEDERQSSRYDDEPHAHTSSAAFMYCRLQLAGTLTTGGSPATRLVGFAALQPPGVISLGGSTDIASAHQLRENADLSASASGLAAWVLLALVALCNDTHAQLAWRSVGAAFRKRNGPEQLVLRLKSSVLDSSQRVSNSTARGAVRWSLERRSRSLRACILVSEAFDFCEVAGKRALVCVKQTNPHFAFLLRLFSTRMGFAPFNLWFLICVFAGADVGFITVQKLDTKESKAVSDKRGSKPSVLNHYAADVSGQI